MLYQLIAECTDYDEEAVREAIVNGIIHREYTRLGAEVCVDIYDDRLEVTSPGCMMSGKIIDKEVDDVVASERRNPVLADTFARMKFMERRGSGLKKITDNTNALFNDGKNHVEFFSDRNYFKVTIHNALYAKKQKGASVNASVNAGVNASVKLSATQEAIISLMRENPQITIKEIASTLGKNETTITRNIKQLKEEGVVKRVGSDKRGYWLIQ